MSRLTVNNSTKIFGAYYTPFQTASYMVHTLLPIERDMSVWEPCVGEGAFVRALLNAGVEPDQIFCQDIDKTAETTVRSFSPAIHFTLSDTLLNNGDGRLYDRIIANPPYLNKASDYVRRNREALHHLYPDIHASETYALFLLIALRRLKPGGRLCFIVSDTIRTLRSHQRLRKRLLQEARLLNIVVAPPNLFSRAGAAVRTCILTLERRGSPITPLDDSHLVATAEVFSEHYYSQVPERAIYVPQSLYWRFPRHPFFVGVSPMIAEQVLSLPNLGDYVWGYIGMHTHNNKDFLALSEDSVSRSQRKFKDFKVVNPAQVAGSLWRPYLRRGGTTPFYREIDEFVLFDPDSIKHYDIPKRVPFNQEGIAVSGVSSRLCAFYRPGGVLWDTNKVIGLVPKRADDLWWLMAVLNTKIADWLKRKFLNSTSCLQLSDLLLLPMPRPEQQLRGELDLLAHKAHEVRQSDDEAAFAYISGEIERRVQMLYGFEVP